MIRSPEISTTAPPIRAPRSPARARHVVPTLIGAAIAAAGIAVVVYLLWPTYVDAPSATPGRIPISVGGMPFNVPERAFRIKVQKHSGPQERVDLAFAYPSLTPPEPMQRVDPDVVAEHAPAMDRIIVSIIAHHGVLAPEERARSILPRYALPATDFGQDGLTMRAFRDGTAYAGEDLFTSREIAFTSRCTRDGVTPGICLSERRLGGADLTFRYPREWLSDWRGVAGAIDRLSLELGGKP